MPETKRLLKVFLCHAHSDAAAVRDLYRRLVRDGVDAWLDKEKLLPGQDWELEIRKAVRSSDIVVVCLSQRFNQAGFRQKEVRLALDTAMEQPEGEIFIVPLRLEECENLGSLSKWQWVDLFEESGYRRLMLAFHEKARRIGAQFELPEQHAVSTSADRSFVSKVAAELDRQAGAEPPSTRISILQEFPAPGTQAQGIAWDGTSLWISDHSGALFQMSPTGNVLDSIRSPDVTPQGLASDGSRLWVFTTNHSLIYEIQIAEKSVQSVKSFRSPAQVLGGGITQDMAWDGEGLWYANQFKVCRLDRSGKVLRSFTFPKNVTGLGWDGSNLWVASSEFPANASLHVVNQQGDILETHVSPVLEITGLAWADNHVWVLGSDLMGGNPMIYELSLSAR